MLSGALNPQKTVPNVIKCENPLSFDVKLVSLPQIVNRRSYISAHETFGNTSFRTSQ